MRPYENQNHPLFWTWKNYCKYGGRLIVKEWTDFAAFCAGVGNKPSERHRLTRPLAGKKLGPDNFVWKEKVISCSGKKVRRPPLYESWRSLGRQGLLAEEWADSFALFRDAIGEVPSGRFILARKNLHAPLAPGNWEWQARKERTALRANRSAYMREYMAVNPDKRKAASLKKQFGMSLEEYTALGERQKWVCAICAQPETKVIRGKRISLSVDHCHSSWRNRGLLCSDCNRAIGIMKDDPDRLRAAAEYLDRHK